MAARLIFHDVEQGSDEWHQLRSGVLSGSDAHLLMVKPRNKSEQWSEGAKTLARKIVAERLLGKPLDGQLRLNRETGEFYTDNFESGAMAWGKYHEKESLILLNEQFDLNFKQVGFVETEGMKRGCSPDGYDDLGIVLEMKHENTEKVIGYFDNPMELWDSHKWQCIHNMLELQCKEVILSARDPRLPEPLNNKFAFIRMSLNDNVIIKKEEKDGYDFVKDVVDYKIRSESFLFYVDELMNKILNLA